MRLRARWLYREVLKPPADAVLEWEGDRVVAFHEAAGPAEDDLAVLPAFVNAHTHLELSGLRGRLPPGPFPAWVRALIALRAGEVPAEAVRAGAAEALATGTAAVGDISTAGAAMDVIRGAGAPGGVVFEEVLGLDPSRAAAALDGAARRLRPGNGRVRPGLSPHAPYSVSAPLFQGVAARAAALGLPLAVHVAESPEELEFLARGTGALRDLLEELRAFPAGFRPPGVTPVAWLARLGLLERRPLLVHANYLDDDDVARIRGSGCAVVFCPRSHHFFGYDQCSVPRLLAAGVTVALGTDSLASAPSLDLMEEVRALAASGGVAPARALHLATRAGGEALGLPEAGRLAPGGPADFTAWRIPAGASDPLEAIVDGSAVRVRSVVRGAAGAVAPDPRMGIFTPLPPGPDP